MSRDIVFQACIFRCEKAISFRKRVHSMTTNMTKGKPPILSKF